MGYLKVLVAAVACFVASLLIVGVSKELGAVLFLASPILLVSSIILAIREAARRKKASRSDQEAGNQTDIDKPLPDSEHYVSPSVTQADESTGSRRSMTLRTPTDDEWRSHARESYERSMAEFMPLVMRKPNYDLSSASFPFGDREYPTLVIPHRSQETGEVVWSETSYCADPVALEEVCKVISTLEFIEEQALLSIPSVPVLKTDLKLMKPVTSCSVVPDENRATLSVNPLTPTGRKPKYPVSVSFNSYRQFYGKPNVGSHGTIDFLPDATPAKADIYYWLSGEGYAASFRLVGDMPTLTLLRTIGEESFVVYRLER